MNKETLLQPSFDKLTEKLDNIQEYEDWLLIQDYIHEIKLEIHNYKQALNELKEYISSHTLRIYEDEFPNRLVGDDEILSIIDKYLGEISE